MMKNVLSILILFSTLNCFAGGSISGTSGDSYNKMLHLETNLGGSEKMPDQVYFMRKKQAEIEFATNTPGDDKVEIQSLRPEEISDSALLEGLKRSQQSKQWENLKAPSKIDINRVILNNKFGGMQGIR